MTDVQVDTKLTDQPTLRVAAVSQLMRDHRAALPFEPGDRVAAVLDASSNPIVFGLDSVAGLTVVFHTPGTATGWTQRDVSASLPKGSSVTIFDVAKLDDGGIWLAAAVTQSGAGHSAEIWVAGPLSDDPTTIDWANLDGLWVSCSNPVPAGTVDHLTIGPVPDRGEERPVVSLPVIAVAGNPPNPAESEGRQYVLRGTLGTNGLPSWAPTPFPTPTTAEHVLDHALGVVDDLGVGLYILYTGPGGDRFLMFKAFTDAGTSDRQLTCPTGATVLCAGPAAGGTTTQLFVAGPGGVWLFAANNQHKRAVAEQIAPPAAAAAPIEDMAVSAAADGSCSVWTTSGGRLSLSQQNAVGEWTAPLLFRTGISSFAAVRSAAGFLNQLVCVGDGAAAEPELRVVRQDATTVWYDSDVPLHDTTHVVEFDSYSTRIDFRDASGTPARGLEVEVAASATRNVVINGAANVVGTTTTIAATTDSTGAITIIQAADGLATPSFQLTASWFDGSIDVDPFHDVATALASPRLSDLLGRAPEASIAPAIKDLMSAVPSRTAAAVFVAAGAALPKRMDVRGTAQRPSTLAVSSPPTIVSIVGDVLEFLADPTLTVASVEVDLSRAAEDIVTVVVKIGDDFAHLVINSAEQLMSTLSLLLDKAEVAFEDIVKWLGFAFDWSDIWQTHRVIADLVNGVVNETVAISDAQIDHVKLVVHETFDELRTRERLAPPTSVGNRTAAAPDLDDPVYALLQPLLQPQFPFLPFPLSWLVYHANHDAMLSAPISRRTPDPTHQFYETVIQPIVAQLEADVSHDVDALLIDLASGRVGTSGEWTVAALLEAVGHIVEQAVIDSLESLIIGVLDYLEILLEDVRSVLVEPVGPPFIAALYASIAPNGEVADGFTMVHLVALLIAIPYTVVNKAATNKAPFAGGANLGDPKQVLAAIGSAIDRAVAPTPEALGVAVSGAAPPPALNDLSAGMRSSNLTASMPESVESSDAETDASASAEGPADFAVIYSHAGGSVAAFAGMVSTVAAMLELVAEDSSEGGGAGHAAGGGATPLSAVFWIDATCAVVRALTTVPIDDEGVKTTLDAGIWMVETIADAIGIGLDLFSAGTDKAIVLAAAGAAAAVLGTTANAIDAAPASKWISEICSTAGSSVASFAEFAERPGIAFTALGAAFLGGCVVALPYTLAEADEVIRPVVRPGA